MNNEQTKRGEMVQHPSHYNNHPLGIECIDIIRHYTCDVANAIKYLWRAGLKQEMGVQERAKEIEDLKKAIWYIEDWMANAHMTDGIMTDDVDMKFYVQNITGHSISEISNGYEPHIARAISTLLYCGLICHGEVRDKGGWNEKYAVFAIGKIKKRIKELERERVKSEE